MHTEEGFSMESFCKSPASIGREHDREYFGTSNGEVWERCRFCGDLFFARYHDSGSGC